MLECKQRKQAARHSIEEDLESFYLEKECWGVQLLTSIISLLMTLFGNLLYDIVSNKDALIWTPILALYFFFCLWRFIFSIKAIHYLEEIVENRDFKHRVKRTNKRNK